MEIKDWIEKAIEGGYDNAVIKEHLEDLNQMEVLTTHDYGWLFLDPKAWEAVGKVESWTGTKCYPCAGVINHETLFDESNGSIGDPCLEHVMLGMMPALIEGKTIEEYIETL